MATTVARSKPATSKPASKKDSFSTRLLTFLTLKSQLEQAEEHLDGLKGDLSADVEELGYKDDKGHYWLELDAPIEAPVFDGDTVKKEKFSKVKKQRSVTTRLDPAKAEAILAKKGILKKCQTTIVVLDEDAIQKAYFKGEITKAELGQIFPQTISWSFRPQKG